MAAQSGCPGCGAEPSPEGAPACACTTEQSPGDEQLRILPYVALPGPLPDEVPGSAPDLSPFAKASRGTGATAQPPVAGEPAGGAAAGSHRKPRRVRRRGATALAATGVAAALGAGLLTSQLLSGGGDSGDDRSLSTDDRPVPADPTGGPTDSAKEPAKKSGERKDAAASAPSSSQPTRHNAELETEQRTRPKAAEPAERKAPATSSPPRRTAQPERAEQREPRERWDEWRRNQGRGGLSVGDTGPEVVDLQRRLKQVGKLDADAPEDGTYSTQVQEAVLRYQVENRIEGDRWGDYGPATKRSLESRT
ncbi:peptidoglycan-binding domain-containing protein [Streptomyces sulphureus]|uniref:peptidoglycan-binding domain-containing protein n=1 Tax=Streptomyces sulphureus TaxID=47758 RepID=UPI000565B832|nr:peptidoglycan-binding domain-containing protein [Streptomyces sulphureus]